jgi:hypothetical protein
VAQDPEFAQRMNTLRIATPADIAAVHRSPPKASCG